MQICVWVLPENDDEGEGRMDQYELFVNESRGRYWDRVDLSKTHLRYDPARHTVKSGGVIWEEPSELSEYPRCMLCRGNGPVACWIGFGGSETWTAVGAEEITGSDDGYLDGWHFVYMCEPCGSAVSCRWRLQVDFGGGSSSVSQRGYRAFLGMVGECVRCAKDASRVRGERAAQPPPQGGRIN